MSSSGFVHLHLHSQYSLLDGAIRLKELLPHVRDLGMDTVAVTDHGNMFGAIDFYKRARKRQIKPIIGCEAYVAGPKGRKDRTEREARHLILLAKNNEGYQNLKYLISMGFMEGFYYHPRIDKDILRKHAKGLYGLSACLGGVITKPLLRQGLPAATAAAKEFKEIFEPGHFFLELQDNGFQEQTTANEALIELGRTLDIPLVATADSHYLRPKDSAAHEVLMCIQQGRSLKEFRERTTHSDLLYVKTPEEMWQAFGTIAPDALENTIRIARDCNVEIDLSRTYLPHYQVPEGHTLESYLEKIATEGLERRIQEATSSVDEKLYGERLDYELSVIKRMGFPGYFLIVWDFIRHAKDHSIPVGPGRGSGAGSLVAWSLRITDLDPIPNGLIFERFLNPDRVSMPDFDIDFCQDRRGEVIEYVTRKYGDQNVGQIVTYSQLSAKSVIKDVGRAMELPFAEVNEVTKLIPNLVQGKKVTIDQAIEIEPKLRNIQEEKPVFKDVIQIARSLEGLNRQTGMHAAGIVIGDKPLWEYVPICRGKDGELVTQFAKDEVEEAGLVKFDFLGLKTLTVIANAVKHIRKRDDDGPLGPNRNFDIDRLTLDDPRVYNLIATADTDGVFQLESSGFKEMLKKLKPDRFEDIVAGVALYRPGPLDAGMVDDYIARKHGRKTVAYPHAACKTALEPTYGVIVYQEQVMRIAVDLCGFTMGEADKLRKAMGKKKHDVMAELRPKFVKGAFQKSGMSERGADDLFTQIANFAKYAFNKSHSAAYAVISYQTALLKTYFPVEFMAALLSTEMRAQENVVKYIQSAREHGIAILPPDVNRSERDFSVVRDEASRANILFGLGAVKGIGDAAIDAIMEAREEGPFRSLFGFCERVDLKRVNRKVVDALLKSGALDCFERPRAQLFAVLDKALDAGQAAQKDRASGQTSLFAAFAASSNKDDAPLASTLEEDYPNVPEWFEKQRLAAEKEALGYYISGHPLDGFAGDLPRLCSVNTAALATMADKPSQRYNQVAIGGVVTALRERPLKSGQGRMAFVTLEDLHGHCEVLVFSKVFAEAEEILKGDEPVLIQGAPLIEGDDRGTTVKLRAIAIESLSEARARQTKRFEIAIPVYALNDDKLERLKELLVANRGEVPARLTITDPDVFETVIALPETLKVNPTDELLVRVDQLFGQKVVRLS
ncbi:DNA polymerase III subunit alpha [Myxococcota bacterium]